MFFLGPDVVAARRYGCAASYALGRNLREFLVRTYWQSLITSKTAKPAIVR